MKADALGSGVKRRRGVQAQDVWNQGTDRCWRPHSSKQTTSGHLTKCRSGPERKVL